MVKSAEVEHTVDDGLDHVLRVRRVDDHIAKLQGVYHVRDLSYDPGKQLAVLEVVGGPKMLTFIKAHIETMPRMPAPEKK